MPDNNIEWLPNHGTRTTTFIATRADGRCALLVAHHRKWELSEGGWPPRRLYATHPIEAFAEAKAVLNTRWPPMADAEPAPAPVAAPAPDGITVTYCCFNRYRAEGSTRAGESLTAYGDTPTLAADELVERLRQADAAPMYFTRDGKEIKS